MVDNALDIKFGDWGCYRKNAIVKARKAVPGEHIETIIDGKLETTNTASDDSVIIQGAADELYIIGGEKFSTRYIIDKPLNDQFQEYQASGVVFAYEYVGPNITFMVTFKDNEIYRIEKNVFNQTYVKRIYK